MNKLFNLSLKFSIVLFILTYALVEPDTPNGHEDNEVVFQRILEALHIKRQSENAEKALQVSQSKAREVYQNAIDASEGKDIAMALSLEAVVDEQAAFKEQIITLGKDYTAF